MKRLLKRIWDRLVILAEVMAVVFLLAAPAMAGEPLQLARMSGPMLGSGAAVSYQTPAYVSKSAAANGGGLTCTNSLAVTAGNTVVVFSVSNSPSASTMAVADGENTYTNTANSPYDNSAGGIIISLAVAKAATSATLSIVSTTNDNANYIFCQAFQYSGLATSPEDKTGAGLFAATTAMEAGTTDTTTQTDELIFAAYFIDSGAFFDATPGSGYTEREDLNTGSKGWYVQDKVVTATGAYSPAATASDNFTGQGITVTLKAATQ